MINYKFLIRPTVTLGFVATLLLSSGCLPAVFVVGATAGGALVYDKRGVETQVDDQRIKQKAELYLLGNVSIVEDTHINVSVFNGMVLLVGQAETPELRALAYRLVSRVHGIQKIYNEITIGQPIAFAARSNDTLLTGRVKAAMLLEKGLESTLFKVVTENGVVYLVGIATPAQTALAVDVARRVPGVQKVVTLFENEQ